MKRATMLLTGAALSAALAALLAASALATPAGSAGARKAAGRPHVQHVQLTIVGTATDEQVSPSMGNLAIAAGVPVRVTVTNFTDEYHTFTIPGLHVSALIRPAQGQTPTKTTFTFTASKTGKYAWHCVFCASGAHGHPHSMGGTVYAIIDPSALP